jgi:hypothetical protein
MRLTQPALTASSLRGPSRPTRGVLAAREHIRGAWAPDDPRVP